MHIGMLTTWNSECGIAEYSKNLITCLAKDTRVTVFCNYGKNTPNTSGPVRKNLVVIPKQFGVYWWKEPPKIDVPNILKVITDEAIDLLHIQYQSSLYEPQGLTQLLAECPVPIVMTLHDSSIDNRAKLEAHEFIVHNPEIANTLYIETVFMPFPIPNVPSIVGSFGLGRNQAATVAKVCKQLGLTYLSYDARQDGWKSTEELYSWIKQCDVIVLWYNEVDGLVGNSAAVRTVIGCNRPIIVNSVNWFKDIANIPAEITGVYQVENMVALENTLRDILHLQYKHGITVQDIAQAHKELYRRVIGC